MDGGKLPYLQGGFSVYRRTMALMAFAALAGCAAGGNEPRPTGYSPFMDLAGASAERIRNPLDLAKMVNSVGGPQQKFETDADFNLRMSKLKPFEICKSVNDSSLKFDSSTGRATYKEWLGDAQIAGYREKNGDTFTNLDLFIPSLDASFESTKTGEYAGQNAFGATAVVEVRSAENVHLVFDPIYKGPLSFPHPYLEADASSLAGKKKDFLVCVIGIPVAPFYRESVRHSAPTITNPYDGQVKHHFFRVKIGGTRLADSAGNTIPGQVGVSPGI